MARATNVWLRLGIGVILNGLLWPSTLAAGASGSYDREAHLTLINLTLATTAMVTIIPLFWRGKPWQAPIAFVLLWLPVLVLLNSVGRLFEL